MDTVIDTGFLSLGNMIDDGVMSEDIINIFVIL